MLQRMSSSVRHRTCDAQSPLRSLSAVFLSIPKAVSIRQYSAKPPTASLTPVSEDQPEQAAPQVIPLQYFVARTPSNNLPVYQSAKGGGTKHLTVIRKIKGDLASLQQDLRRSLSVKDENVTINQLTKQIQIKGWIKDDVVKFLEERNF